MHGAVSPRTVRCCRYFLVPFIQRRSRQRFRVASSAVLSGLTAPLHDVDTLSMHSHLCRAIASSTAYVDHYSQNARSSVRRTTFDPHRYIQTRIISAAILSFSILNYNYAVCNNNLAFCIENVKGQM